MREVYICLPFCMCMSMSPFPIAPSQEQEKMRKTFVRKATIAIKDTIDSLHVIDEEYKRAKGSVPTAPMEIEIIDEWELYCILWLFVVHIFCTIHTNVPYKNISVRAPARPNPYDTSHLSSHSQWQTLFSLSLWVWQQSTPATASKSLIIIESV